MSDINNTRSRLLFPGILLFISVVSLTIPASGQSIRNGKIAFTSNRDGNCEIYTMTAAGTGLVRLTQNAGYDDFPTWSPDGRRIAYLTQDSAGTYVIKTMSPDGTDQKTITGVNRPSGSPWFAQWALSWSPDSKKIAFQDLGNIAIVNADGTNRVDITHGGFGDYEPSWSPDGSAILFTSPRQFYRTMHVVNVDGSNLRALPSDGEYWDTAPQWSPNGNKIVFIVNSEMALPVVYIANSDGTNRRPFDSCPGGLCGEHRNSPRWSPDGTKLLFHSWDYFLSDTEIYIKTARGVGYSQLTNSVGDNFHPSWQPIVMAAAGDGE